MTENPLNAPMRAATTMVSRTPSTPLSPPPTRVAASIPDSAMLEPTERSMPPVMMMNVAPTAAIPTIDDCVTMFVRFDVVRNLGVRMNMTMQATTRAATMGGNSGLFAIRRMVSVVVAR